MIPPMLVALSVHANAPAQLLGPVAIVRNDTRVWVSVGFVDVQPDFLQLLPTQTWVKYTSWDSSRCVVYSGLRVRTIRVASKKIGAG